MVENKPVHYDGSLPSTRETEQEVITEPFELTDKVRAKISGNPYLHETNE
ncbi:hypothetical protein [Fictibacillus phosphorivorans]|nr:hypothetical protein [Fictibacillus phosphorivorans]MCM3718958.1 hypothetical protein [Fictibacillus phosphorivorans]MCM3776580.1 hypothetical protein [Fictibacillus phosphorivorans]